MPPRISAGHPGLLHTSSFRVSNPSTVVLVTDDGVPLGGTRWLAAGRAQATVLIAPATGVPHRFYQRFAEFLAGHGFDVLTWDWRGIGASRGQLDLRDPRLTMRHWGERDLAVAIDWAAARSLNGRIALVGHSFGGQSLGLAYNAERVHRAVFVGAQHGWMGHWSWRQRLLLSALWRIAMPLASRALGYFPSSRVGMGEDLPEGVAREWATWCSRPEALATWEGHAALELPILSLSFDDDRFAPRAAAAALVREYARAQVRHEHHPARGLGHFGFFRTGRAPELWDQVVDFLRG